jgi:hypothetical protein
MRKFPFFFWLIVGLTMKQSAAQNNPAIAPYVTFLKGQNSSAKEYVLGLFKTHDLVIICERLHGEFTQYNLLADIISDKRFIENVGNVFTEVGLSSLNPALNNFMHTKNLPADTINKRLMFFQRNCSFWPAWTNANYSFFLNKIYSVNNSIPEDDAINVYPSDLPFSWATADSSAMLKLRAMIPVRDSIMASQIITQFDKIKSSGQKRKKALIVMNTRHAYNKEFIYPGGYRLKNVAYFLFEKYKDRTANVFLNTVGFNKNDEFELLQNGKWDAAFKTCGKNSLGFDFAGSPFGKDSFDIVPTKTNFIYQDIFTGFIFFQPIENHRLIETIPGYMNPDFKNEMYKRIELITIVNNEFRSKMGDLKRIIEGENPAINMPDEKKYYKLDSLLIKRDYWLK